MLDRLDDAQKLLGISYIGQIPFAVLGGLQFRKGYNFDVLNELTDDGLVNAGGRSKSASFTDEGVAKELCPVITRTSLVRLICQNGYHIHD